MSGWRTLGLLVSLGSATAACGPASSAGIVEDDTESSSSAIGDNSSTTESSNAAEESSSTGAPLCEGSSGVGALVGFAACDDESCSRLDDAPWWPGAGEDELVRRVTMTCTVGASSDDSGSVTTRLDECTGDETPLGIVVTVPSARALLVAVGERVQVDYEKSRDALDWLRAVWALRDAMGRLVAATSDGVELPDLALTTPVELSPGDVLCEIGPSFCESTVSRGEIVATIGTEQAVISTEQVTLVAPDGTSWGVAGSAEYHDDQWCGSRGTYWKFRVSVLAEP